MKPSNLTGFYNPKLAREKSPVVSRPDLVAERNNMPYHVGENPAHVPSIKTVNDILAKDKTDTRIKCYRTDGTCYAVLSVFRWTELRDKKKLEAFLEKERDSGIIIDTVPMLSERERYQYSHRNIFGPLPEYA